MERGQNSSELASLDELAAKVPLGKWRWVAAAQPRWRQQVANYSQQDSQSSRITISLAVSKSQSILGEGERDEESHSHSTAEKCKMCKVCVCASSKCECLLPKGQKSSFTAEQKKAAKRWSKAAQNHSQQQHKKLEKGNGVNCVSDWPRSVAHSMITAAASSSPSAKTQLKSAISSGLGIDLREPVRTEKKRAIGID